VRVLVAGGGGAVGRRLIPLLIAKGHDVVATTRRDEKREGLRALGAEPVLMDGLDAESVGEALGRAAPEVVVHQMTALAGTSDLKHFDSAFAVTNRLRTQGTDHLLAAAAATGVRRIVAQSYTGWPNARDGGRIKTEDDGLDPHPPSSQVETLQAIRYLEKAVVDAPLEGVVLRYGSFYGPGASDALVELVRKRKLPIVGGGGGIWSWIHIDDVAAATVAAVECGRPDVYNIVDDEPAEVSKWLPYLAKCLDARSPHRVPARLARLAIGEAGVSMMTRIRGSSNTRATHQLGWTPRWASWREGFHQALVEDPIHAPGRRGHSDPLATA
jgi:nucleoside-diphosphate-sugar epimerase